MATVGILRLRRKAAFSTIIQGINRNAERHNVILRPFPNLQNLDFEHRDTATIEWIRDCLVAARMIDPPTAPNTSEAGSPV